MAQKTEPKSGRVNKDTYTRLEPEAEPHARVITGLPVTVLDYVTNNNNQLLAKIQIASNRVGGSPNTRYILASDVTLD